MNKSQFIYRNGIAATVTKLDGTSYNTRMLYHLQSRSSQFSETYTFSLNYMRDGVFTPNVDIANGYIVDVPSIGEKCFVVGRSRDIQFGIQRSMSTELLTINYPSIELRRKVTTYDSLGHPVSTTWNLIGTYPATVDYRNGGLAYSNELLLESQQMMILMQNTVPLQLTPDADRLVINGTNYQVDAIDSETSLGMVFVKVELDKRT